MVFQLTSAPSTGTSSTSTSTTIPTPSNPTSAASPTSPSSSSTRPVRRRGLSALRNYTHHRLSSLSGQSNEPSAGISTGSTDAVASNPPTPTTTNPENQHDSQANNTSDSSDEALLPLNPVNSLADSQTSGEPASAEPLTTAPTSTTSRIGGISRIMARHRAGSAPQGANRRGTSDTVTISAAAAATSLTGLPHDQMPTIRLVPHQDPRSNRPSLTFPPMSRTLPHEECVIRVGRYSERDANPNPPPNIPSSAPVGFKSKVVSRRHCEFWCSNGQWYIKDVKSSSGTFLNHIRLSQPSVESRPFPVNDGDVVQLGIDFRGGEEMIFRCVKIRVECNRGWQKALNNFNVTTHKRILGRPAPKTDADTASTQSSECAICLMSIAPCQALFVAPCSHVWHYKCIRPILNDHKTFPSFLCPNCRAVADLEADVDDPDALDDWEDGDNINGSCGEDNDLPTVDGTGPAITEGAINQEDDSLATMTSRQLSVQNGVDSSPEHAGDDSSAPPRVAAPPTTERTSALNTLPSILSRRGNRRGTPPLGQPLPSTSEESATSGGAASASFRPVTPTWPLVEDGDPSTGMTMPVAGLTPNAADMMNADGPMTPRNDAGPFVFDGSAGRRAPVFSHGSDEVASHA